MLARFFRGNPIQNNLRLKITLGIVVPLLVTLFLLTLIEHDRHRRAVNNTLSLLAGQSSKVIENSLIHEMVKRDPQNIRDTLRTIGEDEAIRTVLLLDLDGQVIFASNEDEQGRVLSNQNSKCQACHRLPPEERPSSVVVTLEDGQRIFRSMNPIENRPECYECHDTDQRLNGLLLTDIWMAPIEQPLRSDLREHFLWGLAMIVISVVIVNLILNTFVINRLRHFSRSIANFWGGTHDQPDQLDISPRPEDEIGRLIATFNEMGARIKAKAAENRALSEHMRRQSAQRGELLEHLISAQEDERKRVARELHDQLGQTISGISLRLDALDTQLEDSQREARQQLTSARSLIRETSDQLYDLIFTLRPSILDDLGLVAAIRTHAERLLSGTAIDFTLDTDGFKSRFPAEVETAMYRIFQEALGNVIRHARATQVAVSLVEENGELLAVIEDDGVGFDAGEVNLSGNHAEGLGLLGIRERIAHFGGQLDIRSATHEGTRMRIRIPYGLDYDG